jgi:hypothetical protein
LIVLKTFYDGSNKADSAAYDVVTLAAIHGTAKQWDILDEDWKRVLKKHDFAWLHTTDAVSGIDIYKGRKEEDRHAFVRDCVRVIGKHATRKKHERVSWKNGILASTNTVVLEDFIEAKKTRSDIADTAEELLGISAQVLSRWPD